MPLNVDKWGILHQRYGQCEECGTEGRYVRAVKLRHAARPVPVYACTAHRGLMDEMTASAK
jgi:RNA polymerase-binding transcription factor DksA